MLQPVGPNIWTADGPLITVVWPVRLPTRMIVVKLSNESLWINSPIEASQRDMDEVADLGPVAHLVSPTPLHNWRLAAWRARFPNARCWEPPSILADDPPDAWASDLDQVVMRGNVFLDEVEFFHRASRTVIFGDFIQNYRPEPKRPLLDAIVKLSGTRDGGVPNDIKLTMLKKEPARQSLRKLLSWDFDNLIVAHGTCVQGDAKPLVAEAFAFL